jgi:GNAT superfamily N-acetyltransferase
MGPACWALERIRREHARAGFECGEPALDDFLRRFARQNDNLGLGHTYVAVCPGNREVLGYFTVRTGEVSPAMLPAVDRHGLPRYPVPTVHLARLAVDLRARRQGLGEWLLMEALRKALDVSEILAVYAVEVQAVSERAAAFYAKWRFAPLLDDPLHLYISMKEVRAAFAPYR